MDTDTNDSKLKTIFAKFKKKDKHEENTGSSDSASNSENSTDNTKKGKKEKPPQVKLVDLYKYTTKRERIMLAVAFVASACHGAMLPLFTVVFGDTIDETKSLDPSAVLSKGKWFAILGAIALILGYFQSMLLTRVAYQQCTRIRRQYFRALMRQDFAWYDNNKSGELTARVASDVDLIQAGVGEKVGVAIQFVSMFVIGFIIGFIYSWKLTLVLLAVSPLLFLVGMIIGKFTSDASGEGQSAYGEAGAVAFEALSMIRTVTAYGGQEEEVKRYENKVEKAYKNGVMKGHLVGVGFGAAMAVFMLTYALALYFGSRLIGAGEIETSDVLTAFFAIVIGASSLGQLQPAFTAIVTAQGAAPRIFDIIARQSQIDPLDQSGETLENVQGRIEFKNVSFSYAGRSDHMVLSNLDVTVEPGTTQALVGPSGCGKSTTVGLVERFYDVEEGAILLDGVDVRKLNVQWLRSQIGFVSQQPSLFGLSVRENIALGGGFEKSIDPNTGDVILCRVEVSEEEIINAAKLANAHSFITKLPEGYDTILGTGNSQLSGGQKQRVAIARALVRDPRILCLDEATSALDAKSEGIVQEALDKASKGRTTLVIAHRLSTVKDADNIAIVDQGKIVEKGSHSDLIQKEDGVYRQLVELQNIRAQEEGQDEEEIEHDAVPDDGKHLAKRMSSHAGVKRKSTMEVSTSIVKALSVEEQEAEEDKAIDKGVFRRTFKNTLPDLPFLLTGLAGAILGGGIFPMLGFVFAEVIVKLQVVKEGFRPDRLDFWILMFLVLAGAAFISNYVMHSMGGIVGERLTKKMRVRAFQAYMRQEIGYFDMPSNQIGTLTARLATEATEIKGLIIGITTTGAQTIATLASGLVIACATCWRIALVILALLPGITIGQAFQSKAITGLDADTKRRYAESGGTAVEAVSNIHTVTSLGIQEYFCDKFNEQVNAPLLNGMKVSHVQGFFFGFADFSMFIVFFLAFWVGSIFADKGQCSRLGFFKATLSLIYAAFSLGQISAFAPDVASSRIGATRIFRLIDRESKIDPTVDEGEDIPECRGEVVFDEVEFEYPRRPEIPVLRGVSTKIEAGSTTAFVGASGSGKSTIVALIERFYDPRVGNVLLDAKPLPSLKLQRARDHLCIVLQEGELHNRSVRDNIAYGFSKTEGTIVTDAQIEEAAKAANAHDFISELPEQYDTICGEKGNKLSGGQRQRVSIARALVRNPRVLLLDEATSALDAKSEAIVQEALDKAASGRTTVVVAHRLSTVKDADTICVVSRGKIVESGTHDELMARNAVYANLVKKQLTSMV